MDPVKSQPDLLLRLLSASELRARVISANIANQNTPGFTRKEVRFEGLLRKAIRSGSPEGRVAPEVVDDRETPARPDGNNVNLELELNELRQNRLLFETYAAILQGRGNLKKIALDR
jgi:flagellar basal-body rod protein FlgB